MKKRFPLTTIRLERVSKFEKLKDNWNTLLERSSTHVIFLTYEWQKIWWKHFSKNKELHLLAFYDEKRLVGIAPLNLYGEKICLNGGKDVSDYLDIIAQKGYEEQIWEQLFLYLKKTEASAFDLHVIPETSTSRELIRKYCHKHKWDFIEKKEEVTPFIDLPDNWENYLRNLDRKKRHEIKRKMRKIEREIEGFKTYFLKTPEEISANLETFFELHRKSDPSKKKLMTPAMEEFFHDILLRFSENGWAYLYFAEGNNKKLASLISFVYNDELLLYNSGFDPEYRSLAPGFVLAANTIKEAIDMKLKRYDFLRGAERYKYDLGAKDKNVYNIVVKFTRG